MKFYLDLTEEDGCCGILFTNPEHTAIYVGTTVHTEDATLRDHPLAKRYAEECDFHFFFRGDALPLLYTVPKTEIAGYDSRGGLFAGRDHFSLGEEPLYYIDRQGNCFLIIKNGSAFLDMGRSWREKKVSTDAIEVFSNRAEAEEKYKIWDWAELLKEGDL